MLLNEIKPSPFLTDFVRLYRIIDFHFTGAAIIPPKIYSPRPEHCLKFYPKDTETVEHLDSDFHVSNKKVSCIGQHTKPIQRYVGKDFLSFRLPSIAPTKLILQGTERICINWLVKETCLCAKQFERKFKEYTGVTASALERIVRFHRTVKMKNALPDKNWFCRRSCLTNMKYTFPVWEGLTKNI